MKSWLSDLFKKYFVVYFPWVVVFTASLYPPADSDLGWHLKYGEYFFQNHAILRENIFSALMPNYLWVNSSWVIDLITYSVFKTSGFVGLTLLGAAITTGALYLFASLKDLSFWSKSFLLPLILFLEKPLFEVSFRGQLLSLFLIGILYKLLNEFENGKSNRIFLLIPLFIIWSNLHGQFLFGLVILIIWSFVYIAKLSYMYITKKDTRLFKQIKLLLPTILLAFVGPLINPFTFDVYREAFKHFGNPLQQFIVEWIPFEIFSSLWWYLVIWTVLVIISILILFWKKKILDHIQYIAVAVVLCSMSFFVRRYTWPMLLVSLPVVYIFFETLKPKLKDVRDTVAAILFILVYLYVVAFKAPKESIFSMNWQRYCTSYVGCSSAAVEYIIDNKLPGKLLTFYNWGGYMIWNYTQLQPTIDGRMHLWQDAYGFSAFRHYYPIEQNWIDVDTTSYDTVLITPRKPLYKRLVELVEAGKWEQVYKDRNSGVFVRKKIN